VTDPGPAAVARPSGRLGLVGHPLVLWSAFVLVHAVLGVLNLRAPGYPLGDVTSVYRFWSEQAVSDGYWVGVDAPWVYPVLAIVPMLAARVAYPIAASVPALVPATLDAGLYASTWLCLVLLLDLVAFGVLTGWGRRRDRAAAAWWWIGFLAALGPIALGRIDSVTVPFAMVGVLLAAARPRAAAAALALGAWIKVWPGVLVLALAVVSRERARAVAVAAAVSAAVVGLSLSFGSGLNVLGFVGQQSVRALQIEAPVSTYWLWRAAGGAADTEVYFDDVIYTWQVRGPGASAAAAVMTPLLVAVVAAIVLLGARAVRRGARPDALLPPLALALVVALIAFQKVGSPQFVGWLAVPVVLAIASSGWRATRAPALLALAIAAFTHVVYPYLYGYLISLQPWMLAMITARNALEFVLLGWAVAAVVRLGSDASVPAGAVERPAARV